MKEFPSYPPPADAPPDLLERGHVWLHERVDAAPFRFQALADGRLRFGDEVRTFTEAPPAYAHAVRHVRESFDRDALRRAVDDVESVVFFGRAMHRRGVDYDWERTPNVLGVDIWSDESEKYLQPDRVEKIYSQLGLEPLNTVRAEVRAVDFDPASYTFPDSAWYDGPCAGLLVRNKTGLRCALDNPAVGDGRASEHTDEDAEAFARRHVTPERLDTVARRLREEGRPVTFDTLYERTVESVARAHHDRLFEHALDVRAFRSTVSELTGAYLSGRE